MEFAGQVEKINKDNICFKRIYVCGMFMDGECFDGKEDHVWMSKEGFGDCQVGDCFSFFAEVYRYLKTSNGKMIDFGLRNPDNIKKIESYELPSDDELLMQSIDQIICETCPEDGRMSMKKYGSVGKINQQALGEIIWQMF